jgi:hypothetical protein
MRRVSIVGETADCASEEPPSHVVTSFALDAREAGTGELLMCLPPTVRRRDSAAAPCRGQGAYGYSYGCDWKVKAWRLLPSLFISHRLSQRSLP